MYKLFPIILKLFLKIFMQSSLLRHLNVRDYYYVL